MSLMDIAAELNRIEVIDGNKRTTFRRDGKLLATMTQEEDAGQSRRWAVRIKGRRVYDTDWACHYNHEMRDYGHVHGWLTQFCVDGDREALLDALCY